MAQENIGYASIAGVQPGTGAMQGLPTVVWSGIIVAPDGTVTNVEPFGSDALAAFSYGASGQDIRQAVVAAMRSAAGDPALEVAFVGD